MPQTTQARVFFGNGEWDPRLYGRLDLPGYRGALALMENFFPTALGGARYRDGLRSRFVLSSQRDPARFKMVRAPGYLGAAERILVLDGTTGSGTIEAFAFPYEGNTRFTRTDLWTQSESRNSPGTFNDLPEDIYRARVAFGDYAGTMITSRSFAPLHIGSSSITSTLLTNSRILLALDAVTSHLWQLSRTAPAQSIDLGRMPSTFFRGSAMARFNGEVLAVETLGVLPLLWVNRLWKVDPSNPRASELIGTLNITDTRVSGLSTDGTTLYGCTTSNQIWNINRDITSGCSLVGTLPSAGGISYDMEGLSYLNGQMYGILKLDVGSLAVSLAAIATIDLDNPAMTSIATSIRAGTSAHDTVSLATYGGGLIAARTASGSTAADLVSVDLAGNSFLDIGDLPPSLTHPSGMVAYDVQQNVTEQLGELLDERVERSTNFTDTSATPNTIYFRPRNYVDHLGNHQGEGAHPRCATVFLDRMIFAGSEYLPGTFIGSERYPRTAEDLAVDLSMSPDNALTFLFDGQNGEAISTYNFYWLFFHPLKKALATWEQVDPQDSFSYKINAQRELAILWMVPYNNYLVLGTTAGVWIARDLDPDTPPEVTQYSNIPCADVDPVVTDFGIAYADASRKEVHFANLGVGFEPPARQNAMAFARHLTEGTKIRQLAWQATPQRRLWLLTEDGRLAAWCFEPDANVLGWCRVTNPFLRFCGICIIPGPEVELACAATYEPNTTGGLVTIYLTTLDGRDHLDLGKGIDSDIADDAIIPERDIGPVDPEDRVPFPVGPASLQVAIFVPRNTIETGGMMELAANATGTEAGPHTVLWSIVEGPGSLSSLTERRTIYTAPATVAMDTEVTVRVVATGRTLTASDERTFTVSAATLTVTLNNLATVFEGETARLDATVGGTATGPITYSWEKTRGPGTLSPSSDGSHAIYSAPASVSGAMSVWVTVTVMRAGRSATFTEIFNVDDIMVITDTLFVRINDTPGSTGVWDLTTTVTGTATGPITYSWSITGGGSLSSTSGATNRVTGGVSGSTIVTVDIVRGGIQASNSRILTAPTPVTLTVSISGPTTVDEGGQITLTATAGGTATGPITYTWTVRSGLGTIPSAGGMTNTYSAPSTISADATATVRVSIGRQNLVAQDDHVISINDVPSGPALTVSIQTQQIGIPIGVIQTGGTRFSASVGGTATGPITYSWSLVFTDFSGVEDAPDTFSTATVDVSGPYRLGGQSQSWVANLTIQRGGHSAVAAQVSAPIVPATV